jgi:hypothetical protein
MQTRIFIFSVFLFNSLDASCRRVCQRTPGVTSETSKYKSKSRVIADIGKSKTLNHKGHEGTQRRSGESKKPKRKRKIPTGWKPPIGTSRFARN